MFCQQNPVAVQLLLTWVARFKDKELFCLGVKIEYIWLAALVSVPSQNQGAVVSVTAAFVEALHHFLCVRAERYVAHNPLSCVRVVTLSRPASLLLKNCKNSETSPGYAFQFAKRRRLMVAPGKNPGETSQRRAESGVVGRLFSSPA